jgi:hypothetical protein
MSVIPPEGHLSLTEAVADLVQQLGGDEMQQRKPDILVRLEQAMKVAVARSSAVSLPTFGPLRRPSQGAVKPYGPPPTAEEIAALRREIETVKAEWQPVEERQQQTWQEARRRIRVELAEGRLAAIAVAEDGSCRPIGPSQWRVEAGERAMMTGRLLAAPPVFGHAPEWPVFLPEAAFRARFKPARIEKVPPSAANAAALSLAEKYFREHNDKPFKDDIVDKLKVMGVGAKDAEKAFSSLPERLKRGKGEHAARSEQQRRNVARNAPSNARLPKSSAH